jgi:hypothetical protein
MAMRERVLLLAEQNASFRKANPTQAIADITEKFF